MFKALLRRWSPRPRFASEEGGTISAEFVIVLPILLWSLLGMFNYWDVYRSMNQVQKASFTLSDTLSRSAGTVDGAYIDGLLEFMDFIVAGDHPAQLRVTSIRYMAALDQYQVAWSYSPASAMTALTDADLATLRPALPVMTDLETVILVETRVPYTPPVSLASIGPLDVGLGPQTFSEFIVTRPRFISKVCFAGTPC